MFDWTQLEQRFKGYEAPGIYDPYYIENGLERILPKSFKTTIMIRGPEESDFISLNATNRKQDVCKPPLFC